MVIHLELSPVETPLKRGPERGFGIERTTCRRIKTNIKEETNRIRMRRLGLKKKFSSAHRRLGRNLLMHHGRETGSQKSVCRMTNFLRAQCSCKWNEYYESNWGDRGPWTEFLDSGAPGRF